jgi:hypothetical protein
MAWLRPHAWVNNLYMHTWVTQIMLILRWTLRKPYIWGYSFPDFDAAFIAKTYRMVLDSFKNNLSTETMKGVK